MSDFVKVMGGWVLAVVFGWALFVFPGFFALGLKDDELAVFGLVGIVLGTVGWCWVVAGWD